MVALIQRRTGRESFASAFSDFRGYSAYPCPCGQVSRVVPSLLGLCRDPRAVKTESKAGQGRARKEAAARMASYPPSRRRLLFVPIDIGCPPAGAGAAVRTANSAGRSRPCPLWRLAPVSHSVLREAEAKEGVKICTQSATIFNMSGISNLHLPCSRIAVAAQEQVCHFCVLRVKMSARPSHDIGT